VFEKANDDVLALRKEQTNFEREEAKLELGSTQA